MGFSLLCCYAVPAPIYLYQCLRQLSVPCFCFQTAAICPALLKCLLGISGSNIAAVSKLGVGWDVSRQPNHCNSSHRLHGSVDLSNTYTRVSGSSSLSWQSRALLWTCKAYITAFISVLV